MITVLWSMINLYSSLTRVKLKVKSKRADMEIMQRLFLTFNF